MLNRAGWLELVKSTLAAMSIFAMISLDIQIETARDREDPPRLPVERL
jgi:hypothetical protein